MCDIFEGTIQTALVHGYFLIRTINDISYLIGDPCLPDLNAVAGGKHSVIFLFVCVNLT